ncbi:MAG: aminotransferase class V-fold PLP-dependent enzyme [Pirellulaceae bacterium]|nr:aminotransferase class V-fold PLP-dependent enzyme [Pirellulaceae bacterium]
MQRRIYLDQAATTWPKVPVAVAAAEKFIHDCGASSGRGAYASARSADQWVTAARHNLCRLLGGRDAADVAFCSSGTHALNAAISGLLHAGDHVVTTAIEHNSVLRPLEHWRQTHGVQVDVAPCDHQGLVPLVPAAQLMTAKTRLVIVSHASNVTGRVQDLAAWSEMAHQYGALLMVDASQTVGYLPIDIQRLGIDLLAAAGHKGLGGLPGTGFLVATPQAQAQLRPLMFGGTGTASEQLSFQPAWPQSVEVGNLNLPAIVSMAAAAEHWLREGETALATWQNPLMHLLKGLRERFSPDVLRIIGHPAEAVSLPVVSLLPSQWDVHEAAAVLDANFGIEVRAGFHCAALVHQAVDSHGTGGTLRLSLGHQTTLIDVDETMHALTAMFSGSREFGLFLANPPAAQQWEGRLAAAQSGRGLASTNPSMMRYAADSPLRRMHPPRKSTLNA